MTQNNPVRIYVGHLWTQSDDYLRVFEYLESSDNFYYLNSSAPERCPSADKEAQRDELRRQITDAELVIVPTSLYRESVEWTEFQMNCAKAFDKPVLVLEPFGAAATIPASLQDMADDIVSWDKRQLIDAVKRQARHEETTRFDVIEFKLD